MLFVLEAFLCMLFHMTCIFLPSDSMLIGTEMRYLELSGVTDCKFSEQLSGHMALQVHPNRLPDLVLLFNLFLRKHITSSNVTTALVIYFLL